MTMLPIGNSRVPLALTSQLVINSISARENQLTLLSNQLATGKQINLPGDNPNGAVQSSLIQNTINQLQTYQSNITQGTNSLNYSNSLLSTFTNAVNSAQSIALTASNNTQTSAQYTAAAAQINSIIQQLVSTANSQYLGGYPLSGSNPNVVPFQYNGNYVTYNGDSSVLQSTQGNNQLFPTTLSADSAIGTFSSAGYGTALTPNINGAIPLRTLNGGAGVDLGQIQINTGTGSPVVVDLSHADSIQNVIDIINNNPTLSATGSDGRVECCRQRVGGHCRAQ